MKNILQKQDFLSMPFAVKSNMGVSRKAEVSSSARTVDLIANTYYYFDSYGDVLLPGCCAKSIQERGPKSDLPGKIKHLSNHNLSMGVGRPDLIEEAEIEKMVVLHANSWMSETTHGEDTLIKYKEGIIDQHSIGFNYVSLTYVEPESNMWDDVISKLINPDEAVNAGFMFLVHEIKLFEYSSLDGFGANRLTPFLGVKSDNKTVHYNNLVAKLDALTEAMRTGSADKLTIELQEKQIKQMIYELYNPEPSLKDTHVNEPPEGDTPFNVSAAIDNLTFKI